MRARGCRTKDCDRFWKGLILLVAIKEIWLLVDILNSKIHFHLNSSSSIIQQKMSGPYGLCSAVTKNWTLENWSWGTASFESTSGSSNSWATFIRSKKINSSFKPRTLILSWDSNSSSWVHLNTSARRDKNLTMAKRTIATMVSKYQLRPA